MTSNSHSDIAAGLNVTKTLRKGGGCFASGLIFINESKALVREGKLKYY